MLQANKMKILLSSIVLITAPLISTPLNATPLSVWDSSWTQFADDEGVANNGFVYPGYGGQAFDAEYLYYKTAGTTLYLGLQTGFDVRLGTQKYGGIDYWAGDLALSFDGVIIGNQDSYEYAVDFGLLTKDYNNQDPVGGNTGTDGIDVAGVYSVAAWNSDIAYTISSPFAMETGTKLSDLLSNDTNPNSELDPYSFYRMVSIDLTTLGLSDLTSLDMDVHWTMSCGNDAIDGNASASVPEPGSLLLMATGILGLVGGRKLRRKIA